MPDTIDLYLDHCRVERRLPAQSLAMQAEDLERVARFAAALACDPEDLTEAELRVFLGRLDKARIRSVHVVATLEDYYHFLLLDRRIAHDPMAWFTAAVDARKRSLDDPSV